MRQFRYKILMKITSHHIIIFKKKIRRNKITRVMTCHDVDSVVSRACIVRVRVEGVLLPN